MADPWPLASFFDAFFIGEVEHRLDAIVAALAQPSRGERLVALAAVPGIWLPGVSARPAERQVFAGFALSSPVVRPSCPCSKRCTIAPSSR